MPILVEPDLVRLRQLVRAWCTELKMSVVDATKMITAASELSRNTLVYGGGGRARLEMLDEGFKKGLRIVFEDEGPGIADIEQAMRDGYTSGKGMGLGLSGSKRLVNDFEIESRPGEGTRVAITRWK